MRVSVKRFAAMILVTAFFALAGAVWAETCATPPDGLVGWWPGDGNYYDLVSSNDGSAIGNVGFANAMVGQGFQFTGGQGVQQGVQVPYSAELDVRNVITIEAWISPGNSIGPIVEYPVGRFGAHLWLVPDPTTLFTNLVDVNGSWHILQADGVIQTGVLQHVAVTYDNATGFARLYRNGVIVAEQNMGSFVLATNAGVNIGYRALQYPHGGSFNGLIDEVGIYNRALSPDEIAAIYNAGSAGKCTYCR